MPPAPPTPAASRGAFAAIACYLLWGLVPLYWKQLADINALELIAHRHVWSLVFVLGLVLLQGGLRDVRAALSGPRAFLINFVSATLLTGNWLVYVWGVNTGHVVEASLGYFLVPLVNVATGRFLLHEHLRRAQWISITCAAFGVALLVYQLGRPPWIALALAATWGGYSLMRKQSPLGALTGLTVETLLLAPFAIALLLWWHHTGVGALGRVGLGRSLLVVSAGVITAVPLILFAYGARRIRLSTLGLLQYITPSVQFVLGVWVYHEPFPHERVLCFGFIWAGLALYTADSIWTQRKRVAALGRD
ncbi:EamA family transporter RarD [Opitutus sp. ER46]|uniref:EamA family transporter RarD n=1 Tax=Opitutus sp. ER46 TaxID=2161864 RepID=UPI000D2FDF61|nr:EamA family transporter RarD [Opitutus sp. ER46]PTX91438.1 EamA family transporter RarD [Opitutus sp. ER46]